MDEIVAKSYARLVKAGRKEIDEVPEKLKALVMLELERLNG